MPAWTVVVVTELVDPRDHFETDHEARVDLLSELVMERPAERLDRRVGIDRARLGREWANLATAATAYARGVSFSLLNRNSGD